MECHNDHEFEVVVHDAGNYSQLVLVNKKHVVPVDSQDECHVHCLQGFRHRNG